MSKKAQASKKKASRSKATKKAGKRAAKKKAAAKKRSAKKKRTAARRASPSAGPSPATAAVIPGAMPGRLMSAAAYEAHKERTRARQAEISKSGRDIGELPPVEDPKRRAAAIASLRVFFETYFPKTFYLPWAHEQLQSIDDIERAILTRGKYAEAMWRGGGKTGRFMRATLWAAAGGHCDFAVIVPAIEEQARDILSGIKAELESNDRLAADFPEICYPIRKLEGITQRARGQTFDGQPTRILWKEKKIILPTIPGSKAAGFIIRASSLKSGLRGLQHVRHDGRTMRPDLLLIDDPQTDESAHNPQTVRKQQRTIDGAMLRLSGPDQRVAALASVTLITEDDLAAWLTDRERNPSWHGRRYSLIRRFPADDKGGFDPQWWELWQQYAEARRLGQRRDDEGKAANEFYLKHRKAMDAGVEIAWEHKIEPGDVSAIQSAMNWLIDAPDSFWAEGQNAPRPVVKIDKRLDQATLAAKVIKLPRGLVPADAKLMTAFVDVQKRYLAWKIVAWGDGLKGHVVDYGTWPDQGGRYFKRDDARRTIEQAKPGTSRAVQLHHALDELINRQLLAGSWMVDGEMVEGRPTPEMSIDLCLVDVGDGNETDIIVEWIRQQRNARIMPSRGDGLRPSDTPIPERTAKPGQTLGHHWMIHVPPTRAIRHVFIDTNRWKTIITEGLGSDSGAPNSITICEGTTQQHDMLTNHLLAEYPEPTEARGRKLDVWSCRPGQDNEWFDCLVGCAVAASIRGIIIAGHQSQPRANRRRRASGSWAKN